MKLSAISFIDIIFLILLKNQIPKDQLTSSQISIGRSSAHYGQWFYSGGLRSIEIWNKSQVMGTITDTIMDTITENFTPWTH
ncbi:25480_t:CDS:2 [Gigaspora margarita]|uniref:25480_t:CDS:1 n=1 Tax=Gigaspora margarita TaxID=4874 RepID=A0ABN7V7U8_GIGMA|nr:25480_t:CDS:2 [Gigaspora margarita]